ncbi:MAG: response regulator [bacterium]|nr:response regulator [bacterium]
MDTKKVPKILIVDDNEELCSVYREALEEAGYGIATAQNGKQALDKIEEDHFDLILADKNMPQMGGVRLLKAVRKKDPNIKVVLITAFGGQKSYLEAMEQGADEFLNKPLRIEELKQFVSNILNQPS